MADDYLRRNAARLLREKWATPAAAMEELYMILSDESSGQGNAVSPVAQARAEAVASQAPSLPPPIRPPRPSIQREPTTLTQYLESVVKQLPVPLRVSSVEAMMPPGTVEAAVSFTALGVPVRPTPESIRPIGLQPATFPLYERTPVSAFVSPQTADPIGLPQATFDEQPQPVQPVQPEPIGPLRLPQASFARPDAPARPPAIARRTLPEAFVPAIPTGPEVHPPMGIGAKREDIGYGQTVLLPHSLVIAPPVIDDRPVMTVPLFDPYRPDTPPDLRQPEPPSRRTAEAYPVPQVSSGGITGWRSEDITGGQVPALESRPKAPDDWDSSVLWKSVSFTSSPLSGSIPQVGRPGLPLAPIRPPSFIGGSGSPDGLPPAPAHVAFAATLDRYPFALEPLAYPGAYSGMERAAGDYNPVDGPIYREQSQDDPFARRYYDLRFFLPDIDAPQLPIVSNPVAPGQVVDGSQSPQLQVRLYPGGPNADPSPSDPVTVTILQLATNEVVPNGTWISGITKLGGNYYAQLPIWLGDTGTSATTSGTGSG